MRAWLTAMLLVLAAPLGAQRADEATLHATYVINFVRYSQWPEPQAAEPFVIAVLGDRDTGRALRLVSDRVGSIGGRPLVVRVVAVGAVAPRREIAVPAMRDELEGAQVVFVADSHRAWQDAVVEATRDRPVLTVGTARGFLDVGGMVELFESDGRVYFSVNQPEMARSQVRVSARVIGLARTRPPGED